MKPGSLNEWLTIIANVSVVAGIVFLALEIGQNTQAVRLGVSQELAIQQAEHNRGFMIPEIAEILEQVSKQGYESLSFKQRTQLSGLDASWLFIQQNSFLQYQEGFLTQSLWESRHRAIVEAFTNSRGIRQQWQSDSYAFTTEFQSYINNEILSEANIARANN